MTKANSIKRALLAGVSITVAHYAHAQDETVKPRNALIEEVIVTAQKREESSQDVPISISAFNGDVLLDMGIEDTTELGSLVPGLQFSAIVGFQMIYIRGIGTDNFVPSADPSVATYVDGIYVPVGQGATQSLGKVSRVEVLKGPQGTLFGRNSTGGAISITTEDLGNELAVSVNAEYGSFDKRLYSGSLSVPLSEKIAIGLSGVSSEQDPYYTSTKYETPKSTLDAARIKARIDITDNIELSITGTKTRQATLGTQIGKNIRPSALGSLVGIRAQKDDYRAETDFPANGKSEQELLYGSLAWAAPWMDVKLLLSDQSNYANPAVDFDGSSLPLITFSTPFRNFAELRTAELQFTSNENSWKSDLFNWTFGFYYFESQAGYDPVYLSAGSGLLDQVADIPVLDELVSSLADLFPNTVLGPNGTTLAFSGILDTESYSGYFQSTVYLAEYLDLTIGARAQYEDRGLKKASVGLLNPTDSDIGVDVFQFPLESESESNISPKAVLTYKPNDFSMFYASYSVGYKSGTFNIVNVYAPPNYIKPEEVTSYEIGTKTDLFSGAMRINAAVFYNQITDLQSGFVSLLAGGAVRFLTVPDAETRGADLDITLLPMPRSNPGLAIIVNGAYVDAFYNDFPDGSGFDPDTGIQVSGQDFSGNRIVRTPRVSGGLGVSQSIDAFGGELKFSSRLYYNGGYFYDSSNDVEEDAYTTVDANISYLHFDSNVKITFYGKNIGDEQYHNAQFLTDFGVVSTLAPPAEYGARVQWEY